MANAASFPSKLNEMIWYCLENSRTSHFVYILCNILQNDPFKAEIKALIDDNVTDAGKICVKHFNFTAGLVN
ncbi:hypothetical protein [Bacillus sp. OV322]|uniref:hypothetical protein n=1 Tax=Bacillus sp. OV322 TaxID=1882764 RepID=UPI00114D4466|nr:hypothetical protein [Bacillus sp. OV322]